MCADLVATSSGNTLQGLTGVAKRVDRTRRLALLHEHLYRIFKRQELELRPDSQPCMPVPVQTAAACPCRSLLALVPLPTSLGLQQVFDCIFHESRHRGGVSSGCDSGMLRGCAKVLTGCDRVCGCCNGACACEHACICCQCCNLLMSARHLKRRPGLHKLHKVEVIQVDLNTSAGYVPQIRSTYSYRLLDAATAALVRGVLIRVAA